MALEKHQAAEQLFGESSYQLQRKASELVTFDELIKIHPQQLRRNTEMTSEIETLRELDHTVLPLWIL